ncbi:MAG TPA: hypothetical protein DIC44_10490 [Rikenellaceae bacterium]|nr:hypothetical protein [Rikenellaceae bacterium]
MIIKKDKKYWLYIAPHVYCNIKDSNALLYNTVNGDNMIVTNPDFIDILKALHEKKNLGAICIDGVKLAQSPCYEFIVEFCEKKMGNINDVSEEPEKPVQMMPILNLQRDVNRFQDDMGREVGEDVLQYLLELNLYLNDSCELNCIHCDTYSKQASCCIKKSSKQNNILQISVLKNILLQIKYGVVGKLNLIGGNVLKYPYYNELSTLFSDFSSRVHIWNHYANFTNSINIFSDFKYDIITTFPINNSVWDNCYKLLRNYNHCYHFYITGINDYTLVDDLIEKFFINNYVIHPVYIKTNHDFFVKNVFTDPKDILQETFSMRNIFAHQKLNTNFFGSLTIISSGDVYANINRPALGNIVNNSILELIKSELIINTAWRKIRDVEPCSNCIYQYLCPSPSNYEIILDKSNLCCIR